MSMQTTINTTDSTSLNKQYYDKKLLESAKRKLVHARYGQKRSIPKNHGKSVEFRRWDMFDPKDAILGLTEGVTPESQALSQSTVEAELKQYGAYVEVSDLLDMTAFDNVLNDSAQLLGEQIGTVVEWVTRDVMCAGENVQYAGGAESRAALTADDKLTVDEIRKAVRTLKKAHARPFDAAEGVGKLRSPHFICICSPEATYDLQADSLWQDVSKYSNAEQIYTGEIGRLFGVVFVESTEAKVFKPALKGELASGSTTTVLKIKGGLTAEQAEALTAEGVTLTVGTDANLSVSAASADAGTVTLTNALSAAPAQGTKVFTEDAGANGMDVHATLLFGQDAYGVIDADGNGTVEIIVKPHGSAGADDPLDQRATVGAKVGAYAAAILNDAWLLRIEHAVS